MKQKDIYLADLNPAKGREQRGTRPVVIISGNIMNDNLELFIVCPVTSKIKGYASSVLIKKSKLNKLDKDSEIMPFQIRTISKERLVKKMGEISEIELENIFTNLSKLLRY